MRATLAPILAAVFALTFFAAVPSAAVTLAAACSKARR